MEVNIKSGDILTISGVGYEVVHILSCKDCALNNSRVCSCLDPSISCGEKTKLGFKIFNYGHNEIQNFVDKTFKRCLENRKKYKTNKSIK